jgi:hypothetical protein
MERLESALGSDLESRTDEASPNLSTLPLTRSLDR